MNLIALEKCVGKVFIQDRDGNILAQYRYYPVEGQVVDAPFVWGVIETTPDGELVTRDNVQIVHRVEGAVPA